MYKTHTLKNGLTLITIDIPRLESVTTLVSVGAGSRYEKKDKNGISHFLEHMFFKGSVKYPTAEQIATIIDSIGAINNAATSKEYTYYWIKSAAKHIELATDILSSMLKESLLQPEEIEKEKGVIIEEMRMKQDNPQNIIWDRFENLMFGDQPLGWDIIGNEKTLANTKRQDILSYIDSLYSPKNMALVYAGKIPKNIEKLAENYFSDLPTRSQFKTPAFQKTDQSKPRVAVEYRDNNQGNLILGVQSFDAHDPKRYTARILSVILGGGMSSRLFNEIREKRGLAYHISTDSDTYQDVGVFAVYGGLKVEKIYEALEVIVAELDRVTKEKVTDDELKKAKEGIRGRIALRAESTNFLAEYFGVKFVLDRELETFEKTLKQLDKVTSDEVKEVAKELFDPNRFNLEVIGPFKDDEKFKKIIKAS